MDEVSRKARNRVIRLFVLCLAIAFVCGGVSVYIVITFRGTEQATERLLTICKIIALVGVFFLVMAFGHLLPALISGKNKNKGGNAATGMFSEAAMRQALDKYIPAGEVLLAGIHAVAKESKATCVFGECILTDASLIPDKNGETIAVSKEKHSTYDLYLGITQNYMVVADCERYRYYYQFDNNAGNRETDIQIVTEDILLTDVGKCFRLADIQNCNFKKGMMGSVNCTITMKNGDYFKLILPESGGLGGGMPRHAEYREAIMARLSV